VQVHWFLSDHGYVGPWYQWNHHKTNEKGNRIQGTTEYTAEVSQEMIILMHIQLNKDGKINSKSLSVMSGILELDYHKWKDKADRLQNDPLKEADREAAATKKAAAAKAARAKKAAAGAESGAGTSKPDPAAAKNSKRKKPNNKTAPPAPSERPTSTKTSTSTSSSDASTSSSDSSSSSDSDSD
jgi:hypothetical protein